MATLEHLCRRMLLALAMSNVIEPWDTEDYWYDTCNHILVHLIECC
jgi:hypothetical protein